MLASTTEEVGVTVNESELIVAWREVVPVILTVESRVTLIVNGCVPLIEEGAV